VMHELRDSPSNLRLDLRFPKYPAGEEVIEVASKKVTSKGKAASTTTGGDVVMIDAHIVPLPLSQSRVQQPSLPTLLQPAPSEGMEGDKKLFEAILKPMISLAKAPPIHLALVLSAKKPKKAAAVKRRRVEYP
jgi:hypothetical protein